MLSECIVGARQLLGYTGLAAEHIPTAPSITLPTPPSSEIKFTHTIVAVARLAGSPTVLPYSAGRQVTLSSAARVLGHFELVLVLAPKLVDIASKVVVG